MIDFELLNKNKNIIHKENNKNSDDMSLTIDKKKYVDEMKMNLNEKENKFIQSLGNKIEKESNISPLIGVDKSKNNNIIEIKETEINGKKINIKADISDISNSKEIFLAELNSLREEKITNKEFDNIISTIYKQNTLGDGTIDNSKYQKDIEKIVTQIATNLKKDDILLPLNIKIKKETEKLSIEDTKIKKEINISETLSFDNNKQNNSTKIEDPVNSKNNKIINAIKEKQNKDISSVNKITEEINKDISSVNKITEEINKDISSVNKMDGIDLKQNISILIKDDIIRDKKTVENITEIITKENSLFSSIEEDIKKESENTNIEYDGITGYKQSGMFDSEITVDQYNEKWQKENSDSISNITKIIESERSLYYQTEYDKDGNIISVLPKDTEQTRSIFGMQKLENDKQEISQFISNNINDNRNNNFLPDDLTKIDSLKTIKEKYPSLLPIFDAIKSTSEKKLTEAEIIAGIKRLFKKQVVIKDSNINEENFTIEKDNLIKNDLDNRNPSTDTGIDSTTSKILNTVASVVGSTVKVPSNKIESDLFLSKAIPFALQSLRDLNIEDIQNNPLEAVKMASQMAFPSGNLAVTFTLAEALNYFSYSHLTNGYAKFFTAKTYFPTNTSGFAYNPLLNNSDIDSRFSKERTHYIQERSKFAENIYSTGKIIVYKPWIKENGDSVKDTFDIPFQFTPDISPQTLQTNYVPKTILNRIGQIYSFVGVGNMSCTLDLEYKAMSPSLTGDQAIDNYRRGFVKSDPYYNIFSLLTKAVESNLSKVSKAFYDFMKFDFWNKTADEKSFFYQFWDQDLVDTIMYSLQALQLPMMSDTFMTPPPIIEIDFGPYSNMLKKPTSDSKSKNRFVNKTFIVTGISLTQDTKEQMLIGIRKTTGAEREMNDTLEMAENGKLPSKKKKASYTSSVLEDLNNVDSILCPGFKCQLQLIEINSNIFDIPSSFEEYYRANELKKIPDVNIRKKINENSKDIVEANFLLGLKNSKNTSTSKILSDKRKSLWTQINSLKDKLKKVISLQKEVIDKEVISSYTYFKILWNLAITDYEKNVNNTVSADTFFTFDTFMRPSGPTSFAIRDQIVNTLNDKTVTEGSNYDMIIFNTPETPFSALSPITIAQYSTFLGSIKAFETAIKMALISLEKLNTL